MNKNNFYPKIKKDTTSNMQYGQNDILSDPYKIFSSISSRLSSTVLTENYASVILGCKGEG
ncbi:hypothetical protein A3Q56_07853 [Intoshia linei]|uniref:Uncharacterized protein n=1 Tax=Intoshia linei TaxID=1819745 RepID=A0A177AQZ9_9BILA|nr:hypothetical protein A3Q56_07853 [Intoshia linei]